MSELSEVRLLGQVGAQDVNNGAMLPFRQDRTGAVVNSMGHGAYTEPSRNRKLFYAASQAATTWSVALNTTHTGLVLYNPIGSGILASIVRVGFALSVAPAAIASIGIFGGGNSAGIATHTTPLTPGNLYLGGAAPACGVDAAATLVGTPVWLQQIMGGFTAAALPSTSPAIIDVAGMITVPPGYYCGIAALTAVVGFASMVWEEFTA